MSKNTLKNYVRRTILASAVENAWPKKRRDAASTKAAFRDAAHGTDTGWWNDLIYTADCIRMANRHRRAIAATLSALADDWGHEPAEGIKDGITLGECLIATRAPVSWEDYNGTNGAAADRHAEALLLGLRVAVEYLTHEVAREEGVDL